MTGMTGAWPVTRPLTGFLPDVCLFFKKLLLDEFKCTVLVTYFWIIYYINIFTRIYV